ncbi:MAG TPA: hypothetical protein VM186_09990, partial [Planctomycetota bacterium]|nr:hypothetical protein [Planctomycetota bacterium]
RLAAIALIGRPAGCYPCIVDDLAIKNIFGIEVNHVGIAEVLSQVRSLKQDEIDADLRSVRSGDYLIEASDADAVRRSCSAHLALRMIADRRGLSALAVNCMPELIDDQKLSICAAAARLTDAGIPTACSGDIDGALTMLIEHMYTGRPPFYADWLQRDEKNNVVTFWNCGNAPASLVSPRFEPKISDSPSGKDNVIFDFPLKTGEVTLARLQWLRGAYRMLLLAGRAVETLPALKGTFVNIRFEPPVRSLLETFLRYGFPQHVSIVYEDIEDDLKELAAQAGIEVVAPPK